MVGLGVHAMLFSWLCIVEGMRHHTAEAVRVRGERQRELEVAREAHEHIKAARSGEGPDLGDVDTSYFSHLPTVGLFLKHDPRSVFWDDFVLPKVIVLAASAVSLCLVVAFRFSDSDERTPYLLASFVQLLLLAFWVWKICRAAVRTGSILRQQR